MGKMKNMYFLKGKKQGRRFHSIPFAFLNEDRKTSGNSLNGITASGEYDFTIRVNYGDFMGKLKKVSFPEPTVPAPVSSIGRCGSQGPALFGVKDPRPDMVVEAL
jgi:hypothetical protein